MTFAGRALDVERQLLMPVIAKEYRACSLLVTLGLWILAVVSNGFFEPGFNGILWQEELR